MKLKFGRKRMAIRFKFLRPVYRYNSNIRQASEFAICGAQSDGQVSRRSFPFCTVSIMQPMLHTPSVSCSQCCIPRQYHAANAAYPVSIMQPMLHTPSVSCSQCYIHRQYHAANATYTVSIMQPMLHTPTWFTICRRCINLVNEN